MEFNIKDHTAEFSPADIEQNRIISSLSYLGILFFLPLAACPRSKFGRFHANQGLIFFIASLIVGLITRFLIWTIEWIPLFGTIISWMLSVIVFLVMLAFFLYGLLNTLQGSAKELPFIGSFQLIR